MSLVNVARIKMASRSARAINKNSLVVADPSKAVQAFCTKYHYIDLECLTTGESLVNILSSEDSYAPKSTFSFKLLPDYLKFSSDLDTPLTSVNGTL